MISNSNIFNQKIRSDTLFVVNIIRGLESSDPEIFETAKTTLQKLGRQITSLQSIYLQLIKMPFLLIFLPDMISDSKLVRQVISAYISFINIFIQKKQKYESGQNVSDDKKLYEVNYEKNNFEALFENSNPTQFLHDVLISLIQFIRNLKVFPRDLFSAFVELLKILNNGENETETETNDRTISNEATVLIFDAFASFPETLFPYQIKIITDISINFLQNLPGSNFSIPEHNGASSESGIGTDYRKYLKQTLRMLSRFHITDRRVTSLIPFDAESATLLVSVFPRPSSESGTNNSMYADSFINVFRPFHSETFSIDSCRLFLKNLIDFIPYFSEEVHSIIIEVLLPSLMSQGDSHQDSIAQFLSSISFASNHDLLETYLVFVDSFKEDVQLTSRLKAVSLSLFYMAGTRPSNKAIASISSSESEQLLDCGKSLFLIGEYGQPQRMWSTISANASNPSWLVSMAEAYKILAQAESLANAKDHARSAREFNRAADAFHLTDFQHDFHIYYLKARCYFESICFQVELMQEAQAAIGFGSGEHEMLSENICDIKELLSTLAELKCSSLLLHPKFDEASMVYTSEFIRTAEEMVAAIDKGPEAFWEVVNKRKIVPPPAILSTKQPITIEDVKITNPDIELRANSAMRQFYLEVKGRVEYNLPMFNEENFFGKTERKKWNDDELAVFFTDDEISLLNNDDIDMNKNRETAYFFMNPDNHQLSEIFDSNYNEAPEYWIKMTGMIIICHVSIPLNGVLTPVHSQEIPANGQFEIDFPIIVDSKDAGHNLMVTFFFTAVFKVNGKQLLYRIGREERYVFVHEK